MHCNAEFYYVGKIRIGCASQQRRVVLRRRNTVVGGKCALPIAFLVSTVVGMFNRKDFLGCCAQPTVNILLLATLIIMFYTFTLHYITFTLQPVSDSE